MPWTVADVDSKKKGLSPSQKKKWVSIANAALKRCQAKGGKNCDASAIRIANAAFAMDTGAFSLFDQFSDGIVRKVFQYDEGQTEHPSMEVTMTKEKLKMPQSALQFMDHECFAKMETGDSDKPKLKMVAYSGKPIKNHWYWGQLVIDLDGMKFSKGSFPILENHMMDRKIAFSNGKPVVKDHQLSIDPDKVQFVDTECSEEFQKLSKQGFPYESSIYGVPSNIERLDEDASAEVNGFTMKGPGAIWRQWEFKEASVCVFGHDSNTRSEAFANTELELEMEVQTNRTVEDDQTKSNEKEVMSKMTLKELQEQNPEAFSALMESAKEEVTASVTESVTATVTEELTAKFTKEKEDLETKHSEESKASTDRILELEKKDAIRTENELKHRADGIWTSKLTESNIPEHLFAKVSAHVPYAKHVKDGVLDEKGFSEAIDAEIKDWEDKGVTSSVLGMSFQTKDATGNDDTAVTQLAKENDEAVGTLSQFVDFGATD